jgi:serine/threonine protein kinase
MSMSTPPHPLLGGVTSPQRPAHRLTELPKIPDFELLRPIGAGSYGEVWLARSTATGVLRALKMVHRNSFTDPRPFEREFEGILKFERISRSHPSQLALFHVGRSDSMDCFYYVMELADAVQQTGKPPFCVPGLDTKVDTNAPAPSLLETELERYEPRTLRSDLASGRLPARRVLDLALALTEALAHLHAHGLVHRDIKPSNIIFAGGFPKLADIGLVTESSSGDGRSIVGTEGYLPPEGPGTVSADLFALSRVLYEALTGLDRRKFPELPADLRQWSDAKLAFELNVILLRAGSNQASQRYPGAAALKRDLERLKTGGSVKRRLAALRLTRWTAGFAAAAASLLLLGFGVSRLIGPRSRVVENSLEELGTTNLLAREQFLQGLVLSEKVMIQKARDSFLRATELDPNFARAHAHYGRALMNWDLVIAKGPADAFASAEQVIQRARALDPDCGDAWTALGILRMTYGANFREAESYLRRGIQRMAPDLAPWNELSRCLAYQGKFREAVEVARRGLDENPTRLWPRLELGQRLVESGDFYEAANVYRDTIHLFPEINDPHLGLGDALELAGDAEGAAKAYLEWRRLKGDSEAKLVEYQARFAKEGLKAFWRPDYEELIAGARPPLAMKLLGAAEIFAVMGETERAFTAIGGAFEHGWNLGWLRVKPHFASLRGDPRFQRYLDRLAALEKAAERKSTP